MEIASHIHQITCQIPRMDGSMPECWSELNLEQQEMASKAVREIYDMPHKLGKQGQMSDAETLHDLWWDLKLKDGWTLGNYDRENKKHPCMIPFDDLPDSERCKDLVWVKLTEAFWGFYNDTI